MKTITIVFAVCLVSNNLLGQTNENIAPKSNSPPATLTTTSGKVFNSFKLIRVEPDGLVIEYAPEPRAKGMAKVKFENLSAEIQQKYGFDVEAALAFRSAHARDSEEVAAKAWAEHENAKKRIAIRLAKEEMEAQVAERRRIEQEKQAERVRIAKEKAEEEARLREAQKQDMYEMSWRAARKAQEDQQRARDIWRETHPDYRP